MVVSEPGRRKLGRNDALGIEKKVVTSSDIPEKW